MIWKARLAVLPLALVAAGVGAYALDRGYSADFAELIGAAPNGQIVRSVGESVTRWRVVDADTLVIQGGERIRVSNLDGPELPTRAHCQREATLGLEGKAKLNTILSVPGADIRLIRDTVRPLDRYGRTLGRITVNGEDVAQPMIAAGVARPWRGRSSQWCAV